MRMFFVVAASLALATCGDSHDGMKSDVSAMRVENQRHYDAVMGLDTMGKILDEEARHDTAMTSRMRMMNDSMGGMSHCSGMMEMKEMMGDLDTMMGDHTATMRAAQSPSEAQSLCAAHYEQAKQMLDRMGGSLGDMCGR